MEGFFGRLKVEFFYGRDWSGWSIHGFMDALDEYIHWHNEERIKLSLGGMILCDTEDHWGSQHRLWDEKMSASPNVNAYLTTRTQFPWDRPIRVAAGQPMGQRARGILLQDAQARASERQGPQNEGGGEAGRAQVHRAQLQHAENALIDRL